MGWAKYHEDNVSRYWRDAKTEIRIESAGRPAGPPKQTPIDKKNEPGSQRAGAAKRQSVAVAKGRRLAAAEAGGKVSRPVPVADIAGESNVSKLKDFTIAAARPLPVIVLADVSGSMSTNGKIDALNDAIKAMIESFAEEDPSRAEIHVGVIAFGKGGARIHQPLRPSTGIQWQKVSAAGNTPMGAAFDLVVKMIEDPEQVPGRAYRPAIVLISDGEPTDDWEEPLARLLSSERAAKASRFVLGVGDDADPAMLAKFLADPTARVYSAHEARQIKNFFRWVTMSVTQRTRSSNPNSVVAIDPVALDEYDF